MREPAVVRCVTDQSRDAEIRLRFSWLPQSYPIGANTSAFSQQIRRGLYRKGYSAKANSAHKREFAPSHSHANLSCASPEPAEPAWAERLTRLASMHVSP